MTSSKQILRQIDVRVKVSFDLPTIPSTGMCDFARFVKKYSCEETENKYDNVMSGRDIDGLQTLKSCQRQGEYNLKM